MPLDTPAGCTEPYDVPWVDQFHLLPPSDIAVITPVIGIPDQHVVRSTQSPLCRLGSDKGYLDIGSGVMAPVNGGCRLLSDDYICALWFQMVLIAYCLVSHGVLFKVMVQFVDRILLL